MARYDDLDTGAIAYGAFLSSILLLLIVLLVRALCFYWIEGEMDRKLTASHYVSADEEISEQKAQISGYQRIEVDAGLESETEQESDASVEQRVRIPVDRAKEILLQELSGDEPAT